MDPGRLRLFVVAPLAAVLLIFRAGSFLADHHSSNGSYLPLPKVVATSASDWCMDDRNIVVKINANGDLQINETPEDIRTLGPVLAQIFEHRTERVAFMLADPHVPFERVADAYSQIRAARADIDVALVTPGLNADIDACTEPNKTCRLDFPDHKYTHSCFFDRPAIPIRGTSSII